VQVLPTGGLGCYIRFLDDGDHAGHLQSALRSTSERNRPAGALSATSAHFQRPSTNTQPRCDSLTAMLQYPIDPDDHVSSPQMLADYSTRSDSWLRLIFLPWRFLTGLPTPYV